MVFLQLLLLFISLNQSDHMFHMASTNKSSPFKHKFKHILAPSFAHATKWGKAEIVSEYDCFDLVLVYIHGDNDLN